MKVAILHDWLTGFRGGERVLEAFCEMFPDAPVYTLIHKKDSTSSIIESREIHTSFLDSIPGVHESYRKFLPLFPKAAESLVLPGDIDLVLSSSHCVIKGVKKPANSKHICYIHSPMRYLYDQYENYFGKGSPIYQRLGMKVFRNYLTTWDQLSNSNVDLFIPNSEFVKQRVMNYYHRDSEVVHPFVDLKDFRDGEPVEKEDFYLMVTAFAPNKRVDLAVEAFNKLGLSLKIVGGGQQETELKKMAKENIEFLGNLSREEVVSLYKKAKAFIFPGVEDFGITPLESLASGTPVIAYKVGGVLETLNDDVAEFFEQDNVESLIEALRRFQKRDFSIDTLIKRASDFSKDHFVSKMNQKIEKVLR